MVEYALNLDLVFGSLSDPTRRNILERLLVKELSVSEVAEPYQMSLAAVSKHLKVLEKAQLITRRRQGNEFKVKVEPTAMIDIDHYLEQYRNIWNAKLDRLDQVLESNKKGSKDGRAN